MKMRTKVPIYLLILTLFISCAQIAVNNRLSELKETLEPLLGIAKQEDMVRMFGIPERKEKIGNSEFWYIHISYGQRASVYSPSSYYVGGKSWESYDDITLEFDRNGTLISYRFFVQR